MSRWNNFSSNTSLKNRLMFVLMGFFYICYYSQCHSRGDSLSHPMLITVFCCSILDLTLLLTTPAPLLKFLVSPEVLLPCSFDWRCDCVSFNVLFSLLMRRTCNCRALENLSTRSVAMCFIQQGVSLL